jgi:predicted dehydrogenase
MKNKVTFVLIGAGNRGQGIYGKYALSFPHRAKFIAVVEPDEARRVAFAEAHEIPPARQFTSIGDFFGHHQEKIADALIIATIEDVRGEPIRLGMQAGYAVLCEKPLGLSAAAAVAVTDAAQEHRGLFMVCHQMRYTPLYLALKRIVASGKYGHVINIEHSENVSFEHMSHSFVRGVFNNDALTPMILAKSCHDMDILLYLTGAKPLRIASFGGLAHFRSENAPECAPAYCLDGCPAAKDCPYDVRRIYFRTDTDPAYLRQMGIVRDHNHLLELLKTNRYGRCVYRCDNNVVDHQVCSIEFEGGVTASFVMDGHNGIERRRTRVFLSEAEVDLDTSRNTIEISRSNGEHETLTPAVGAGSHSGGDHAIMENFVDAILTGREEFVLTSAAESLDSHLLSFAAEASRHSGRIVNLADFEQEVRLSEHALPEESCDIEDPTSSVPDGCASGSTAENKPIEGVLGRE